MSSRFVLSTAGYVALCALAGVAAVPDTLSGGSLLPWLAALAALLGLKLRSRSDSLSAALLALAAFSTGAAVELRDVADQRMRTRAWLGEPGVARELHLVGSVTRSPQRDAEGDWRLRIRARPETAGAQGPWLVLALTVRAATVEGTWEIDELVPGDRVRVWGRVWAPRGLAHPGAVDPASAMRARGIDALGTVKSARLIERLAPGRPGLVRWAGLARSAARRRLDRAFGEPDQARALVGAMLLGDREALSEPTRRDLRRSGMSHVVAISGLHVGIAVGLLHGLLGRIRVRGWSRWVCTVGLLVAFSVVVGGTSSVWRAVLAAAVIHYGGCGGRGGRPIQTLVLIAVVLVLLRPAQLTEPGFQLSFLATLAILGRPGCGRWPADAAGVSAAAYVATVPVAARHFGWVAPIGIVSNLAAVPLCAVVLLGGGLVVLLVDVPLAGEVSAHVCRWAAGALIALSAFAGAVDFGALAVPAPSSSATLLYYTALLAWGGLSRAHPIPSKRRGLRRATVAAAALMIVWVHLGPPPPAGTGKLEACVLDVGQGLAVALRGEQGRTVLFDASGSASSRFDPGRSIVVPFLLQWSGRRVEALVLSHDHLDHVGGAAAVLEALEVGQLWLGPGSRQRPRLVELAARARERGTALVLAERGMVARPAGFPMSVLGPLRDGADLEGNSGSVVVLAGSRPSRLLLPGDAEGAGESEMLEAHVALRAEALVVAHHGSRHASSAGLLQRVRPRWALVSCGFRNRFGHPHLELVDRVDAVGAALLRTDLDGTLYLEAGPRGWRVGVERGAVGASVRRPSSGRE